MDPAVSQFAAFIPRYLAHDILHNALPEPGRAQTIVAAALFADVTGFTQLTSLLAAGGTQGAESLHQILYDIFGNLIDIVHASGGSVCHFYGDALLVYFIDVDGHAALRALTVARAMQAHLQNYMVTIAPAYRRAAVRARALPLSLRIGAGYGVCHSLVVGSPDGSLEYVLSGPAVEEATAAEQQGEPGSINASQTIRRQVQLSTAGETALLIEPLPEPPPLVVTPPPVEPESEARLLTALGAFLPPTIAHRMLARNEFTADHRPVTSLFLQFKFRSEPAHEDGALWQAYYHWAWRVIEQYGRRNARVNRVLTGDKGNQLHILFGAPVPPHAPDQALLCALALQQNCPDYVAEQRIGAVSGKVFACTVGSAVRCEYTVIGEVVNLSARLMELCRPGDVLTDSSTADQVGLAVAPIDLPPVKLKGMSTLVRPVRITSFVPDG